MHTTSISLIQRLGMPESSETDWERFNALYKPLLMFWAEKRLGLSRDEADDLTQEVLILMMAELPGFEFREGGSFRSWLRVVVLNKGRDYLRKKKRQPGTLDSGPMQKLNAEDHVEFLTDQEYNAHLARQALELMKNEFQESTWKACWLHVVDGLPANEISEQLGISGNAVYLAKARVLKRLREELNGLWVA